MLTGNNENCTTELDIANTRKADLCLLLISMQFKLVQCQLFPPNFSAVLIQFYDYLFWKFISKEKRIKKNKPILISGPCIPSA